MQYFDVRQIVDSVRILVRVPIPLCSREIQGGVARYINTNHEGIVVIQVYKNGRSYDEDTFYGPFTEDMLDIANGLKSLFKNLSITDEQCETVFRHIKQMVICPCVQILEKDQSSPILPIDFKPIEDIEITLVGVRL
jgi:hypothetical protein